MRVFGRRISNLTSRRWKRAFLAQMSRRRLLPNISGRDGSDSLSDTNINITVQLAGRGSRECTRETRGTIWFRKTDPLWITFVREWTFVIQRGLKWDLSTSRTLGREVKSDIVHRVLLLSIPVHEQNQRLWVYLISEVSACWTMNGVQRTPVEAFDAKVDSLFYSKLICSRIYHESDFFFIWSIQFYYYKICLRLMYQISNKNIFTKRFSSIKSCRRLFVRQWILSVHFYSVGKFRSHSRYLKCNMSFHFLQCTLKENVLSNDKKQQNIFESTHNI